MAINFLNTINLNKNQLNQAALENLASDPATGVLGQVYYNTTDSEIRVCTTASTATPTNAVWSPLGSDTTYDLASAASAIDGVDINLTGSDSSTDTVNIIGTDNEVEIAQTGTANQLRIGLPADVTISNDLTVSNDAVVEGSLGVSGDLTVTSDAFFNGSAFDIGTGTSIDIGANKLTNVADPTTAQDAATKSYVDTAVTGLLQFISGFNATDGELDDGSGNDLYTDVVINVGDYYVVTTAGNFFGNTATPLTVGDSVIAQNAVPDPGTTAPTEADFIVVQSDTDLATDAVVGLGNVVPGTSATVTAPYTSGTATIDVVDSTASQKGAVIVAESAASNLEGIDVSYLAGTASVGLDIQGLTAEDGTSDPIINFSVPFYSAPDDQNYKITLADIASLVNENTSKSGIIDAGDLSGTVVHSFGANTMVQTLDLDTGETVFCDIARGVASPFTVTATISAAYASDIIILVQKINS